MMKKVATKNSVNKQKGDQDAEIFALCFWIGLLSWGLLGRSVNPPADMYARLHAVA